MGDEKAFPRAPIRVVPLYSSLAGRCYINKWESILDCWEMGYVYTKEEIELNVRELMFWLSIVRHEWAYVNTAFTFIDASSPCQRVLFGKESPQEGPIEKSEPISHNPLCC